MRQLFILLFTVITGHAGFAQHVGIGTTVPLGRLSVAHTSTVTSPTLLLYDSVSLGYARLQFQNSGGGKFWQIGGYLDHVFASNSRLDFYHSLKGNVMTLSENGNVGIGDISPEYTLDVANRMRLRGGGDAFSTAGIWYNNMNNSATMGFIGVYDNHHLGLYGSGGAGWGMLLHTTNGNVGIGAVPDNNARLYAVSGSTALYAKGLSTNATALKMGTGKIVVENAGVNTGTSVFVHKATAANTPDPLGYTVIDHPNCNNNPSAILIVTMNGTYGSGSGAGYTTPPEQSGTPPQPQIISTTNFMVFYNGPGSSFYDPAPAYAKDRWLIRTYTGQYVSNPLHFNFNVMVVNPN